MAAAKTSKANSSRMAFLAAAMFCLAGVGECVQGIRHGANYMLLGVPLLASGGLWIAAGVRYRRAEKQAASD
ncbi:MAG: hypothetical protein V4555_14760 [Acidobacteriota bacterium]